jgi:photosystem II stability/assembly factor-like uncharacterized protein
MYSRLRVWKGRAAAAIFALALTATFAALTRSAAQAPAQAPSAQDQPTLTLGSQWIETLHWREIGPASMGGRIVDIEANPSDPTTYYLGTASGGLWKTTNDGESFKPLFQYERTVSIGDVAISRSNPNVLWIGTGEHNPRNSVSYGDGVYKSTDAGETWAHMGLEKSFQIGRIAIHHTNPDIVYVGALGRLYGDNEERGLYKTDNGGRTWEKIHYVDEKTGVIEVQMHPTDPDTLLFATYNRWRTLYDVNTPPIDDGPGGGIWKTTDGGRTIRQLSKTNNGLPNVNYGRVGIDYMRGNPNVAIAIIETERTGRGQLLPPPAQPEPTPPGSNGDLSPEDPTQAGQGVAAQEVQQRGGRGGRGGGRGGRGGFGQFVFLGVQGEDAQGGGARITAVTEGSPAAEAGLRVGDVITSIGETAIADYAALTAAITSRAPGDALALSVRRGNATSTVQATLGVNPELAAQFGQRGQRGQRGGGRGGGGRGGGGRGGGGLGASLDGQNEDLQHRLPPDGYESGGLFKTTDGGETWKIINTINPRPMYYSQPRIFPNDESQIFVLGTQLHFSEDGGNEFNNRRAGHVDNHGMWISDDGRKVLLGNDGGLDVSDDGGRTFRAISTMALSQFYDVDVTTERLYRVGGGLQDNGSHMAPHMVRGPYGTTNRDWSSIGGGDGFVVKFDPAQPNIVYSESQGGSMGRRWVGPRGGGRGGRGGDPDVAGARGRGGRGGAAQVTAEQTGGAAGAGAATGQEQGRGGRRGGGQAAAEAGQRQGRGGGGRGGRGGGRGGRGGGGPDLPSFSRPREAPDDGRINYNWKTDFTLSPHNSKIFFAAGSYVLKSSNYGADMQVISPRISLTDRGSGTAITVSPLHPDVLYAGTDDGGLWVTRDGGFNWTEIHENVGLPTEMFVATLEASRFAEGRCYAAFDGHRSNEDGPFIYVTENYGETWTPMMNDLPAFGSTRGLREDTKNPNVLYLGTEFAAFVSIDRGKSWAKFNSNLPTVAVHDYAISDAAGELVAATHGRGVWILDISWLQQMTPEVMNADVHLFEPHSAVLWEVPEDLRVPAPNDFVGENPPFGSVIYYSMRNAGGGVTLTVADASGREVRRLSGTGNAGLNKALWDLKNASGALVAPGTYRVTLAAGSRSLTQEVEVVPDPGDEPATHAARMMAEQGSGMN